MIRNLTPHEVTIIDPDGTVAHRYPPADRPARLAMTDTPRGVLITAEADGLPAAGNGDSYIVSLACAAVLATQGRDDLLIVTEPVKDSSGRVIGCRRLSRVAAQ